MCLIKIEKNIPYTKDPRVRNKYHNPLYLLAKKMEVGDSVKINFPEHTNENEHRLDIWNKHKNLKRYLLELYGKGSVVIRDCSNIGEKGGYRVWRIK